MPRTAIDAPTPLLGGLSPAAFMRRHWQKKPLLVRQALPPPCGVVDRPTLFEIAAREGVESRLIRHDERGWTLCHGPFTRRALPPLARPRWTLLVQGLDLHHAPAHALMQRFRFVPDARLDDVMVSYASDGGGVGPHLDSYDVFLLQLHGRRRWRIGRVAEPRLQPGVPLKILTNFVPDEEWLLEPGDMLYLPPRWAHDGIAEGECMTCSIGFRVPARDELARGLLQQLLDADEAGGDDPLYRDPHQLATDTPARVPAALRDFALAGLQRWLQRHGSIDAALGEWLSEPKPGIWFDAGAPLRAGQGLRLDARTRMLYDQRHVFINGESFRAGGHDATLMRRLADRRRLAPHEAAGLGREALELVGDWAQAGWLHADDGGKA
ncbi:MAG: cupin domain-containing protein [Piscinibacter sp.]|uniref:cupin domain-containing protein n=1 Tax=Piscinibacter TaxID=1114981 RepID=UPI000FDD57F8|nr:MULTISPECIES: cupin domain-containing protein [Piscinibacter]MCW5663341.1 cupin domain-containing protein [Piscinibacter sp.]